MIRRRGKRDAGQRVPYEAFAFGASRVGVSVGGISDWTYLAGVFDDGVDLSFDLPATTKFNRLNTGHSAQFVHSYADVKTYFVQLVGDLE